MLNKATSKYHSSKVLIRHFVLWMLNLLWFYTVGNVILHLSLSKSNSLYDFGYVASGMHYSYLQRPYHKLADKKGSHLDNSFEKT